MALGVIHRVVSVDGGSPTVWKKSYNLASFTCVLIEFTELHPDTTAAGRRGRSEVWNLWPGEDVQFGSGGQSGSVSTPVVGSRDRKQQ